MERRLVIFEGADRVGKTTAKQMFNEASSYGQYVVDRLFFSDMMYSLIARKKDIRQEVVTAVTLINSVFRHPILFVLVTRDDLYKDYPHYAHEQSLFEAAFRKFITDTNTTGIIVKNNSSLIHLKMMMTDVANNLNDYIESREVEVIS